MDILVCTCGTTYKQTGSQITGLTIEIMRNGEGKFSRFATFATQESWSPAIHSEVAANIAFAIFRRRYTGGRGIDLEAYTYVRGRVHLFTNAQPRIPISKGYILDRQPAVLAQDNRDKWSVIRRSLKRGHSYELPEPPQCRRSISNCAALRSRFAYLVHFSPWTVYGLNADGDKTTALAPR